MLTLTATPIPRTLALTLHGDLEVSQIDELPPGRKAIQTTLLKGRDRTHAYDLMRREIAQGRQIYVVLPLVEESEKLDLRSAIDEHQRLQEEVFPEFKVGLLHGRMSAAEKDVIGEVILTAPDIDADVFVEQIAPRITEMISAVTLYSSDGDSALATSKRVDRSPRLGDSATIRPLPLFPISV